MRTLRLALISAVVATACLAGWLLRPVHRPDVLLITADTLRADHLGIYGYALPTSPVIDKLAASGAVFDRAFTQATLTGPAHATLMTGLEPPSHGVLANGVALPEDLDTLADLFRAAGYETAAFVGHSLVGPRYGFDRGFETVELHEIPFHGPGHTHPAGPADGSPQEPRRELFDAYLRWRAAPHSQPTFAWLHLQHAHQSYEPPSPWDTRFAPDDESADPELRCLYTLADHESGALALDRSARRGVVALYDGEIGYLDAQLARVFEDLERRGGPGGTVVALTADHGEMLFDDPDARLVGHGRHRHDAVLRTPLILAGPGVTAGRRPELVSLVDLTPTLAELAGIRPPAAWQGHSLVPLLRGAAGPRRELTFSCTSHSDGTVRLSARSLEHKLVCDARFDGSSACRLYDLGRDPAEREERAASGDPDGVAAALERSLQEWLDRRGAQRPGPAADPAPEARELLRRGGYLPAPEGRESEP